VTMMKQLLASIGMVTLMCSQLGASRWNKLTRLEVGETITIPGATLSPGEYVVKLVDSPANRHIVRFLNGDQSKVIATVIAVPNRRMQPTGETELGFYETPTGEPLALRSWFYPGDSYGQEFVYPEKQARMIAGKAKRNVPAMSDTLEAKLRDRSVSPGADPDPEFERTAIRSLSPEGREVPSEFAFAENASWDKSTPAREKRLTYGRFVQDQSRSRTDDRARRSIEREVGHELVMLTYYGMFDHLRYKVDGSRVTLLGSVTRPTLKSSAENVVKDIEGVESVINNIEVLPLSPSDDRIRHALYSSIFGHSSLNRYAMQAVPPIHIVVKNGNVTLEGVVATESDKNIAGIQAKTVSGVFSVNNNLQVEGRGWN
jgi:hyperosmotically inducible periplasmic protein